MTVQCMQLPVTHDPPQGYFIEAVRMTDSSRSSIGVFFHRDVKSFIHQFTEIVLLELRIIVFRMPNLNDVTCYAITRAPTGHEGCCIYCYENSSTSIV